MSELARYSKKLVGFYISKPWALKLLFWCFIQHIFELRLSNVVLDFANSFRKITEFIKFYGREQKSLEYNFAVCLMRSARYIHEYIMKNAWKRVPLHSVLLDMWSNSHCGSTWIHRRKEYGILFLFTFYFIKRTELFAFFSHKSFVIACEEQMIFSKTIHEVRLHSMGHTRILWYSEDLNDWACCFSDVGTKIECGNVLNLCLDVQELVTKMLCR